LESIEELGADGGFLLEAIDLGELVVRHVHQLRPAFALRVWAKV
jgi:hypothetical protein